MSGSGSGPRSSGRKDGDAERAAIGRDDRAPRNPSRAGIGTRVRLRPAAVWAAVAFAAQLLPGAARPVQEEVAASPRPEPRSIRLQVVDDSGSPLPAVAAGDLTVVEEGEAHPVASLSRVEAPWRIVLWFDRSLSERRTPRNAAVILSGLARALTEAGTVEALVAGEDLDQTLPPTRDPLAVEQTLSWLAVREEGADEQRGRRAELLAELGLDRPRRERLAAELPLPERAAAVEAARDALAEDRAVVAAGLDQLLAWVAREPADGPSLLLLVSGGFDVDSRPFYVAALEKAGFEGADAVLPATQLRPALSDVAAALATAGWRVAPFRPDVAADIFLTEPEAGDTGAGSVAPEGEEPPEPDREPGVEEHTAGVDLLEFGRRRRPAEPAVPLTLEPAAPLVALAAGTGGRLVRDATGLGEVLAGLAATWQASWQGPPLVPGEPREIEVRWSGPGERHVRAPAWIALGQPPVVAEARLRRLLMGTAAGDEAADEGDLPVAAVLRTGVGQPAGLAGGELVVHVLDPDAVDAGALRATVAIGWGEAPPSLFHRRLATPADPEGIPWREPSSTGEEEPGEGLLWAVPVPLAGGAGRRAAVLVEDLAAGRWGIAEVAVVERGAAAGEEESAEDLLLPAPKLVHLLAPEEVLAVGATVLRAVVSDRRVARIELRLDGRPAATAIAPEWAATVDLGELPVAREIEAVAFGADGTELGRDLLVVNEGAGSLRVRIVEPAADRLRAEGMTGPVDVEAEIRGPGARDLERVEFYWNADLVATRFGPPWRQRVVVPESAPRGFVRVVAWLADGTAVEDVVFLNSPGAAERLDVALVELYLVVTDRDGRPVRGLDADAFEVEEDGERQSIATFAAAGELPLTVGLAIDASASMFVKLPRVQEAAADFVLGLLGERDKAFVVGFGSEPSLFEETTAQAAGVVRAISALRPQGKTAVWKAIVYSLVQLQGAPGRKALVVFSDGADEDEEFPYRTCLRFARRLGIPIYVIVANSEIVRTQGKSGAVRSFLDRLEGLVNAVGGRVYLRRIGDDLSTVYQEIAEELRSQYLLAYYPQGREPDEWRRVKVEMTQPGLTARTISGYYR